METPWHVFVYGFQSQKQLETVIPIICQTTAVTVEEMIVLQSKLQVLWAPG